MRIGPGAGGGPAKSAGIAAGAYPTVNDAYRRWLRPASGRNGRTLRLAAEFEIDRADKLFFLLLL